MPSPSSSLATQRPDLAESFMEFDLMMERQGFVANRVLPIAEVSVAAGTFGIIPIEQLLQQGDTKRAPGGNYNRGNYEFDDVSFACKENGWEEPVDDREAQMYRNYFDAEQVAAMRAYSFVLRNAEQRVADLVFNTTTFTPTAVTNEWDDEANATPIADVEAAVQRMYDATGCWANALIVNKKVFRNLRLVTEVKDAINSAGAGNPSKARDVTVEMLQAAFDLDHVIVAGNTKNTANEGQNASPGQIWSGEYAMVTKIAETKDFKEPCIGRTFHWSEDGSEVGGAVESYRDETARSDITRVRHDTDEQILYTSMGQLLSNITT